MGEWLHALAGRVVFNLHAAENFILGLGVGAGLDAARAEVGRTGRRVLAAISARFSLLEIGQGKRGRGPISKHHRSSRSGAALNLVSARNSYETFLTEWKVADVDLPIVSETKKSYAKVGN